MKSQNQKTQGPWNPVLLKRRAEMVEFRPFESANPTQDEAIKELSAVMRPSIFFGIKECALHPNIIRDKFKASRQKGTSIIQS